jgi:hypothetical protein
MSPALDQMIDALGLEVATIQKRGSGAKVELRGGELIGQAGGSWLYRFLVMEDLNLRDETPIRVTVGQEDVVGNLVSFGDGVLVVALEKNLGPKIALARLAADDSFLLDRLKERLEKCRAGQAQLNKSAAERILGLASIRSADVEPSPAVFLGEFTLNPDQAAAVRRSMGSDATYVWGPPGTGKTMTLARIVEAHFRAGHSVLLVSNTNIAVDTALERIAERLQGETDFHQGLVIRQGPVVKPELRGRFGKQVILEEIVARLGAALSSEKRQLQLEATPLEATERSLLTALKDLEQLASARTALPAREKARDVAKSQVESRRREEEGHRTTAAKLRLDAQRAESMNAVARFFTGLNPERLARAISVADRSALVALEAVKALAGEVAKLETAVAVAREEVDRLSKATRSLPPIPEIQAKLTPVQSRLAEIRARITAIDQQLAELEQQAIARCRILATTVYRTYLDKRALRQFDVVVIDEASMLMPPLIYYAAGISTKTVVVAGDFRQLPPIVQCDEPAAAEWLKRDVFEIAGIPRRLVGGQPTPQLVALGTQYRMRESICSVINDLFYSDRPLRSAPSANSIGPDFPFGSAALLYVDTTPFNPWTALRVGTYSRYNLLHALLMRNIVLHLAELGFLPPLGEANHRVGAVSPYASQARLIQTLLEDRLGDRAAGVAATVHRFQGNEKSAMLLDLTDSIGASLGRFLQATRIEEDGARLLNVAASRARHHVVLVANFEYLRAKAPGGGYVQQLLDHFARDGQPLDLKVLLPLAESDWIDGLHKVLPATFELPEGAAGAFTEGTFYPVFSQDLIRARESIVILSPFATRAGTGRWTDALRTAIGRGVQVRILTRPPDDDDGGRRDEIAELIRGLRALGIAVDLRSRMHEKIAIIDSRILWHGSLNILSHRDTHESMLRMDSPAACAQLARFVSSPVGRGEESPRLHAPENPECPVCGGPTVWNTGQYGVYFKCEASDCVGKVDARRSGRARRGQGGGSRAGQPCPKPGCGGRMAERRGSRGRFLGCTNYPRCRHTEDLGSYRT